MQLYEQYRPQGWAEVVGQEKVLAKIDRLRSRGLAGRAFWLSGQSGTGKTTIARLIASEVAEGWNTDEVDATDLSLPPESANWSEGANVGAWGPSLGRRSS